MTASARRHAPFSGAVLSLGGAVLLALLALASWLAVAGIVGADQAVTLGVHGHSQGEALRVDHHHGVAPLPSIHPAISTRAPRAAFALPAAAIVAAAWIFQRLRLARSGRPRVLGILGLPPERAPPALRIA